MHTVRSSRGAFPGATTPGLLLHLMIPHFLSPLVKTIGHPLKNYLDLFLGIVVHFVQAVYGLGHCPLCNARCLWTITNNVVEEFSLLVLNTKAYFVAVVEALGTVYRLLICVHRLLSNVDLQLQANYLRSIVRNIPNHEME